MWLRVTSHAHDGGHGKLSTEDKGQAKAVISSRKTVKFQESWETENFSLGN